MRNFILGKTLAAANKSIDELAAGAVGFAALGDDGKLKTIANTDLLASNNNKCYFVLKRSDALGGPVILPVFKNHFSSSIGAYTQATAFSATITLPDTIIPGEEYTVILVKKGVKFNERNKWTANVVAKESDTATTIADRIVAYFMDNDTPRYGVSASNSDGTITFEGETAGTDYTILGADALLGAEVEITATGSTAYGDASYVRDLANKAAADAGFEYTYRDDVNYLYPDYPLNPLKQDDSADTGFTIITMRFAEPREVKTVDDVVHQIIQVALPSGVSVDALTTILEKFGPVTSNVE